MKTKLKPIKRLDDFYALILQALDALVLGDISELLLFNIWGGHGSGKTYALNQLKNRVQDLGNIKVLGPYDLVEHNQRMLDVITADVSQAGVQHKKLILLDNLRSVVSAGQEDLFIYDIEEKLISPVISVGDSIIIVASLHEIKQWRSVEVRSRHKTILMPPATVDVFREAVKSAKLNYQVAFKKTIGHLKLLEWLREDPTLGIEDLNRKAIDCFLNGLDPETKKIAQALSLSFSFNVPAYQTALRAAKLDGNNSYFSDLKKIKELGAIGLITYESNTGMYRFPDPVLRGVLARSFREEFPDLATEIYSALADLSEYEATFINSLPSHFLNVLYYQAWSAKLRGFSFPEWLDQWFYRKQDAWKAADWQEVSRGILSNPSSKYILDEIKKIAGTETYKRIVLKIRWNGRKNEK